MDETVIELRENNREFILLTLKEDGTTHLSYYNKIIKDGVTQVFENELEAWRIFKALQKALLL